uniref:Signal transducing adapter molecule 1 n=1 Tax=Glossina austeni TaxID=7395 RepID=A0A1A9UDC7_GLOAU
MGIFGQSSPFDSDVEKVTSDKNTDENWALILEVCDKASLNSRNAKECLKAIMRRMNHADPHVVMHAITLLNACVNNCGKPFHLEIASREFENEYKRLLAKAEPKVSSKMRQVLKSWAEGDFKSDPELNLIPTLYGKLRADGYEFTDSNDKSTKLEAGMLGALVSKDTNVVSSQQEEDDLAKAIELSLKEVKNSPKKQSADNSNTLASSVPGAYPSLYPFGNAGGFASSTAAVSTATHPDPRKVSALYDFEAAEENELTFFTGEIIHVTDDSDPNWWRGFNQRGEGLFPANFVTADLPVGKEHSDAKITGSEPQRKAEPALFAQQIEIDEHKIDRLLHLLHEANPEDPSQDTEEMHRFEQEVHQMGPLIDAELERVDRKHAQLSQLSSDLVAAINMYHSLMRDDRATALNTSFMGAATPGLHNLNNYHPTSATVQGQMHSQVHMGLFGPSANFRPQSYGAFNTIPYNNITIPASVPIADYHTQANAMPGQYQNGHINPHQQHQHQTSPMTGVPPRQVMQLSEQQTPPSMYADNIQSPPASQHVPHMLANSSANSDFNSHQQSQQGTTSQFVNYRTITSQHQQQQQPQQPFVTQQSTASNALSTALSSQMPMNSVTQITSQQQCLPPQQHNSYMTTISSVNNAHMQPTNTAQLQLPYNPVAPNSDLQSYVTQLPATMPSSVAVLPSDRFDHLHQPVANISLGPGQNPSYTQNLTQNIPIYQQQR